MFPRGFRRPKRAKVKVFLKLSGKRGVFAGLPWLRSSVALGAYIGHFGECCGASALIVHQHSKTAHLRLFGAIAFSRCCNKSVLRAF